MEEMDLETLAGDIRRAKARALKAVHLDVKPELVNQVYPLLESLVEQMQMFDSVLGDLVGEESIVQPDLAAKVLGTLAAGELLANLVRMPGIFKDDLAAKKAIQLADAYLSALKPTIEAIQEVSIDVEEDGEEEDGEEEDGEEEDVNAEVPAGTAEVPAGTTEEE